MIYIYAHLIILFHLNALDVGKHLSFEESVLNDDIYGVNAFHRRPHPNFHQSTDFSHLNLEHTLDDRVPVVIKYWLSFEASKLLQSQLKPFSTSLLRALTELFRSSPLMSIAAFHTDCAGKPLHPTYTRKIHELYPFSFLTARSSCRLPFIILFYSIFS